MKQKDFLTDEQVEIEIAELLACPEVKLAKLEQRIKYRRRQYLYSLRTMKKRGAELTKNGITEATLLAMDTAGEE